MTENKELLSWLDRTVQRIIEPTNGRTTEYIAICIGYDDNTVQSGYIGCRSVELATAAGIIAQDGAELRMQEVEEGLDEGEDENNDKN